MRSVWSGALSLSLVNVPVKLGSSSKDGSLDLHMVRKADGARIKFRRVAEGDESGAEVQWSDIAKAYDAPDGSLVLLEKPDFEKAYGDKNRVAELVMFTDASNVPPLAARSSYWVQPEKGGEKAYALLAGALQESGAVGIVRFAMREREAVAVLRPHDGYLSLSPLEWDADLVKPDFPAPPQTASGAEVKLAGELISQMTSKYDHAAQADTSTEALRAVIQAKIETGQVITPASPRPGTPGAPADLVATLKAAVSAQKGKNTPASRRRSPQGKTA